MCWEGTVEADLGLEDIQYIDAGVQDTRACAAPILSPIKTALGMGIHAYLHLYIWC